MSVRIWLVGGGPWKLGLGLLTSHLHYPFIWTIQFGILCVMVWTEKNGVKFSKTSSCLPIFYHQFLRIWDQVYHNSNMIGESKTSSINLNNHRQWLWKWVFFGYHSSDSVLFIFICGSFLMLIQVRSDYLNNHRQIIYSRHYFIVILF